MSSCEGCSATMATRGQPHAPDRGADSRSAGFPPPSPPPFPLPPSLWSLCPPSSPPCVIGGGPAPSLPSCPPPSRRSVHPVFWSPSRSLGMFASLFVPCPGEPALSGAVVGHTVQAHCSPPPSSLSTSGQLLIRVAARVRPTGSSAHRRCGALASHLHRPCIAASFASVAPMPPSVLIYTCVLPLLVPLPQHWNHRMAHVASPTLAVVPPPHPGGPATSTGVCAQYRGGVGVGVCAVWPPGTRQWRAAGNQRQIHAARHRAITSAAVRWPLSLSTMWVPFSTSLFSVQAPPLLPPLLLPPLLPPFSCLPAWSLASLVAQAPACRRPRHSRSP